MFEIRHYITASDKNPFADWLKGLRDKVAKLAIIKRLARVELGNFGDHEPVGDGVYELRLDLGPGYRVYYAMDGKKVVLLLCGGNKSTQGRDIKEAKANWADWKTR